MSRTAQLFWGAVSALRARLPLYGDDEARIATRHADAMRAVVGDPRRSMRSRVRTALALGERYRMPSSVAKLADVVVDMDDCNAFLESLEAAAKPGQGTHQRLVRELARELDETHAMTDTPLSHAANSRASMSARPLPMPEGATPANGPFGRAHIDGNRIGYAEEALDPDKPVVLVIGRNTAIAALDWSVFEGITSVHVLEMAFGETPGRLEKLRGVLPPSCTVTLSAVLADEVAQYTAGDQAVSDFVDAVGDGIIKDIARTLFGVSGIDPLIRPILSLKISDQIYRRAQQVHSAASAARRHPGAQFVTTDLSLVPALASVAPTWMLHTRALTRGMRIFGGIPTEVSESAMNEALVGVQTTLEGQLASHLKVPRTSKPTVVIATSSRLPPYAKACDSLREHLAGEFMMKTLDFRPPPTLKEFVAKPQNTLSLAIAATASPHTDVLADVVVGAMSRVLATLDMAGVSGSVAFPSLRGPILQITTSLFGLLVLFEKLVEGFEVRPPDVVLAVPGRLAEVRTVLAAGRKAGVPTVDLQVLFVSAMARYKAPDADRHLAMDAQTRDLYRSHFGMKDERVDLVGSLQLDREMAVVRAFDATKEKQGFGLRPDTTLITYGAQTFPEEFIYARAAELAEFCLARDTSLCIKLHPKQVEVAAVRIRKRLAADFPTVDAAVVHKEDFARVLAATDILVTHFSNVGVSAAAAGVPVVSVPTPDGLSGIDLSELGASLFAANKSELHTTLGALLDEDNPEMPYKTRNPQMGDGGTLDRIADVLRDLSRPQGQTS